MRQERVWELDFFRGICMIGVVIVHIIFDLQYFMGCQIDTPLLFDIIQKYGSLLFILISGICVTLGHRSVKRGLIVFGCGMLITVVTYMVTGSDTDMVWFGILHLLGICMLLYPLLKSFSNRALIFIAILIIAVGYWFHTFSIPVKWFFPFGLISPEFGSGDYFPIFPNLGYFIIGILLGRTVYREKKSILPKVKTSNPAIRAFSFLGRHSLWIYLGHQPIVYGILMLAMG